MVFVDVRLPKKVVSSLDDLNLNYDLVSLHQMPISKKKGRIRLTCCHLCQRSIGMLCVRIWNFRKDAALRTAQAANTSHKRSVSFVCSVPSASGFEESTADSVLGNSAREMTGLSRDGL